MSIITISRGSYSRGKEVAEKLAQSLDYECVSRDILLEACKEFNIPEMKLVRALHDAPSILERFQHGKERFLSYYRYALLKHMKQDNIVYHGLGGQYILKDIPHVLKVRIIADIDDRIKEEMKRENITAKEALYILKKDDDERRKWGIRVHGADTWDSRLYDVVLHIGALTVDDAVDILYQTIQKPTFRTTPESRTILENLEKASRIQAKLVDRFPLIKAKIVDGVVYLSDAGEELKKDPHEQKKLETLLSETEGVSKYVIQEPLVSKDSYINPYHNI